MSALALAPLDAGNGAEAGELAVVYEGRDMSPTIQPGDVLLVDRTRHPRTHAGVFLLATPTPAVVRISRVVLGPNAGRFIIQRDNPSYQVDGDPVDEATLDAIGIVGEVVKVGTIRPLAELATVDRRLARG